MGKKKKQFQAVADALYGIYHRYDIDGGFGDAVHCEDLIAIATKAVAEGYVRQWHDPHVYKVPDSALYCGTLEARPLPEFLSKKDIGRSPADLGDFLWGAPAVAYEEEEDDDDEDEDE